MKILVVDDSQNARDVLRLQLQHFGAEVETADSAEAALERIKEVPPDAIFMDHNMPGMNGSEALEILKADPTTAPIQVVICASHNDPIFIAHARRRGALDFLPKSAMQGKLPHIVERLQREIGEIPAAPAASAAETTQPRAAPRPTVDEASARRTGGLAEEDLDERVRAALRPLLEGIGERLADDPAAKREERLTAYLEAEVERLRKNFIQAQSEQAQITTNRLISEVLPQMVQQQIEQARVSAEPNPSANARQLRRITRRMYVLAAGAAFAGMGAAAAVYFLLR